MPPGLWGWQPHFGLGWRVCGFFQRRQAEGREWHTWAAGHLEPLQRKAGGTSPKVGTASLPSSHPPFSQQRACLPCTSPSFQPTLPYTHFLLFLFLVESVSFSWYHCLRSKWIAIDSPSQQAFAELLSQVGVASSEITVSASKPSRTPLWWVCTLLLWEHRGGTSVPGLQQASQESWHLTWLFKEKRAGARRRSGKVF